MPVGDDLVPLGDEHAAAVGPFLHRIVDPVEVRPPERLVFALVEALGRGVHRDGDLVRIAGLDAVPGEFEQRPLDVVDGNGFGGVGAARHRLRAAGRHPGFDGARHQPVPQPTGGAAVVAVVVLDGFQDRRGAVGVPGVAQFTEPGVFGDRRRRGGDLAVAQLVAHVERLQALDAVVFGAHPNALAHQGIQIDEHAVAKQFVDLLLADPVAARQPQQRALLVGRVVVDVHARITLAPLAHQGQEVAQRLTFLGAVVGPEGMELIGDAEHAPQVLQPPLVPVGGPQRITLEVEEQVALVRVGQHHQGLGVDHAVRRQSVGPVGHLQPGLFGQRRHGAGRQFRHRPGMRRQVVHGRDAGIDQPRALADPHAGDQQQIVGGPDLSLAFGAPETRPHGVVLPGHRSAAGKVGIEQALQRIAARSVHRQDLVEGITDRGTVAEDEVDLGGHRNAGSGQGFGVGRHLQQRLHLDRPRQLGVAQPVAGCAVGSVFQKKEVRESGEAAIEHRGLENHRGAALDGAQRLLGRSGQPRDGVVRAADDDHVVVAAQPGEVALLVIVAEFGGADEQFVIADHRGPAAEPPVERPQQRVFAASRGGEVGGAVDDRTAVAGDEHGSHCR